MVISPRRLLKSMPGMAVGSFSSGKKKETVPFPHYIRGTGTASVGWVFRVNSRVASQSVSE
jgi:hypothetical protein